MQHDGNEQWNALVRIAFYMLTSRGYSMEICAGNSLRMRITSILLRGCFPHHVSLKRNVTGSESIFKEASPQCLKCIKDWRLNVLRTLPFFFSYFVSFPFFIIIFYADCDMKAMVIQWRSGYFDNQSFHSLNKQF